MKKLNCVSNAIKNTAFYVLITGFLFIVLGISILFKPEIVTLIVVSIFVFIGIISLLFGLSILNVYSKIHKILKKFKLD